MDEQTRRFREVEADRYFVRNAGYAEGVEHDPCLELLERVAPGPSAAVLEVGYSDGWRLERIRKRWGCEVFGLELSAQACAHARRRGLPEVRCGDVAEMEWGRPFDVVLVPFVLHWVGRSDLARAVAAIDAHVVAGGWLLLSDFWEPDFRRTPYHHADDGIWTYKQDYAGIFTSLGSYEKVEQRVFSYAARALPDALDTPPEDPTDAGFAGLLRKRPQHRDQLLRSPDPGRPPRAYTRSEELLERAQRSIPLGTQTFSKSRLHFPEGAAPAFIERARGCVAWDVDGNAYLDFVNALCAVTLGHADPDVDSAVRAQLSQGVSLSLAHPLEMEVAERIVELVPCAERVRFGKNGSDATAGAVRLARAYTGRKHIALCGYHGWHDWSIGTTSRDAGVPTEVAALSHPFVYNDIGSLVSVLEALPGQVAGVILEPASGEEPAPGFLEQVREQTTRAGAVLIFDEVVTGFRLARGGAQERYGVLPDLVALGKGLANGYPLSAVAGRAELMEGFADVFYSFTFGGEALSLAAAKAVLDKLVREPVIEHLHRQGEAIRGQLAERLRRWDLTEVLLQGGLPPRPTLSTEAAAGYTAREIETFLMQELLARGVLLLGAHNLSYAHRDAHVARLMNVYDEVLPQLATHLERGDLREQLRAPVLEGVFRPRQR